MKYSLFELGENVKKTYKWIFQDRIPCDKGEENNNKITGLISGARTKHYQPDIIMFIAYHP